MVGSTPPISINTKKYLSIMKKIIYFLVVFILLNSCSIQKNRFNTPKYRKSQYSKNLEKKKFKKFRDTFLGVTSMSMFGVVAVITVVIIVNDKQ